MNDKETSHVKLSGKALKSVANRSQCKDSEMGEDHCGWGCAEGKAEEDESGEAAKAYPCRALQPTAMSLVYFRFHGHYGKPPGGS